MISRLCQYLAGKLVICLKASEDIQDNGNKYDEAGEVTIAESDDRDVYAYGIEIFISLVSNIWLLPALGS